MHPKKLKIKPKSEAGSIHGMNEGEKRRLSKETRKMAKEILVDQMTRGNQAHLVVKVVCSEFYKIIEVFSLTICPTDCRQSGRSTT